MKIRNKILLVTAIIALIFLLCTIVVAEYRTSLEGRRVLIQEEILERNIQIEALQDRITETLAQLSSLDERIETHQGELNVINVQLLIVSREIDDIEAQLNRIEESYLEQREAFEARLVAQYKAGETRYLDVILRSTSLEEFISSFFLIAEIAQHDTDLLDTLERQRVAIEVTRAMHSDRQRELSELQEHAQRSIIAIENTRTIRQDHFDRLTSEEREIQAEIDAFRFILNNIENDILMLALMNLEGSFVGGQFAWPAPGNYIITSRFGLRIHPIFRYSRMHTGVDIATPMGAPIVAANDGTVIMATYTMGYGNTVMIDHGGGIVTLYAHGSAIVVNRGDVVTRGQLVMLAGSTGFSTGPHLHFEIRVNRSIHRPITIYNRKSYYTRT
ncbi:MAG: peptidoglycan DD-metalloendopeptidase family protein [Oscillospiraceae bacterium]|nr:peptidoglycan DD-metalloendopeptidase family protein [Oscillospiraceae bacterium]